MNEELTKEDTGNTLLALRFTAELIREVRTKQVIMINSIKLQDWLKEIKNNISSEEEQTANSNFK
jgi:hypothetical protein